MALCERVTRLHIYPRLGARPLRSIKRSEVQAWVKYLEGHLAPPTTRQATFLLATIFKAAIADRLVSESPCVGINLPRVHKIRIVPLTISEVRRIIEVAADPMKALVLLAASTGLRSGELLGLQVQHVDFLHRHVEVAQQMVYVPGQAPFLAVPKTPSSLRVVPVPSHALLALSAHLQPAGLSEKVHFHHLRHHYASLLIDGGESVKTVQERLGHASAAETLDTYTHLWPKSDERTRDIVSRAWSEAPSEDLLRTTDGDTAPDLGG